jgi:hypothetical protein
LVTVTSAIVRTDKATALIAQIDAPAPAVSCPEARSAPKSPNVGTNWPRNDVTETARVATIASEIPPTAATTRPARTRANHNTRPTTMAVAAKAKKNVAPEPVSNENVCGSLWPGNRTTTQGRALLMSTIATQITGPKPVRPS